MTSPTVYAFMDESGDPGSRIHKGASAYFVLALVETTHPEQLRDELRQLRVALGLPTHFEFRFHDTRSLAQRAAFFVLLRSLDLRLRVAVIDKERLPQNFDYYGPALYPFALGELVARASPKDLHDAILVMDGERGKTTVKTLVRIRKYLTHIYKEHARVRAFKKLITRDSRSEDGLQFADMVAGAVAERVRHGESLYDDYIDARLADLWLFPGQ